MDEPSKRKCTRPSEIFDATEQLNVVARKERRISNSVITFQTNLFQLVAERQDKRWELSPSGNCCPCMGRYPCQKNLFHSHINLHNTRKQNIFSVCSELFLLSPVYCCLGIGELPIGFRDSWESIQVSQFLPLSSSRSLEELCCKVNLSLLTLSLHSGLLLL